MTKEIKTRAMKKLEDSFKIQSGVISNHELIQDFYGTFRPAFKSGEGGYHEKLYRIGEAYDKVSFNLGVSPSLLRGDVSSINLPEFVQLALREAQKYRIIHRGKLDGNYLVVDNIGDAGSYVIASNNNPKFGIEIASNNKWVASQITIKEYEGTGVFKYLPDMENHPFTTTIKTSVPLKAKGDREKLTKRLFLDFHNKIKKQYQDKGATHLNKSE